jgi:hypothetical protein
VLKYDGNIGELTLKYPLDKDHLCKQAVGTKNENNLTWVVVTGKAGIAISKTVKVEEKVEEP